MVSGFGNQRELQVVLKLKDEASQGLKNFQAQGQNSMAVFRRAVVGAGLAAGALAVTSVKAFANTGDEIAKMSKRTGFSTEALSELRFVASQSGTSLVAVETGVRRFSSALDDMNSGLAETKRDFDAIGISAEDLQGLSIEEQFFKVAGAVGDLEDQTQKLAITQGLFGRAGSQLLPMLQLTAEEMRNLRDRAHELGIVFTPEMAQQAEAFTDRLDELSRSWEGLQFTIAQFVIPVFQLLDKTIQGLVDNMERLRGSPVGALSRLRGVSPIVAPSLTSPRDLINPGAGNLGGGFNLRSPVLNTPNEPLSININNPTIIGRQGFEDTINEVVRDAHINGAYT